MKNRKYKVVSLFSGAGGLDLGLTMSGRFSIVFANDILVPAMRTYSKNLGLKMHVCGKGPVEAEPGVALACDIESVDFSRLRDMDIDVVIGGPPCQDFSIVRGPDWDRKGIEVKRGRLYAHFVRALATLQPKAFIFENVPGLTTTNKGLAYKVILEDFSNLKLRWKNVKKIIRNENKNNRDVQGYKILISQIVDFSRLGVPQKRERLIIIGVRRDLIKDINTLWTARMLLDKHLSGRRWLFWRFPLTPLEVFEGQTLPELEDRYVNIMKAWEGVWEEVGTKRALEWKRKVWDKLTFDVVADYLQVNRINRASREELDRAWDEHRRVLEELGYLGRPVYTLNLPDSTTRSHRENPAVIERMKRIPPGENHEFVRGTKWEVEGRGISLVYRRLHPLRPAYTVVAYGGGGTRGYHYQRDRATLTLREKARLQTFPDSFLFSGSKTEIRAQIGEAVPPLASKRIGEALAELLDKLR